MIREASAMKVRQNLGELLNEVQYRNGKILITKAGKPVAAIVNVAFFERLRKLEEDFEKLAGELEKAFKDIPPEKGMEWVDEAVSAARKKATKS